MSLAKRPDWFGGITRILQFTRMPKGENDDLLLFVVPKVHRVATLIGCH